MTLTLTKAKIIHILLKKELYLKVKSKKIKKFLEIKNYKKEYRQLKNCI